MTILWVLVAYLPVVTLNAVLGYPYALDWADLFKNLAPLYAFLGFVAGVGLNLDAPLTPPGARGQGVPDAK